MKDKIFVVVGWNLNDLTTETYYTIHILDNGKLFVELGGNADRFLAGTGIYLKKNLTLDIGATSAWEKLGKFDKFFVGIGTRF